MKGYDQRVSQPDNWLHNGAEENRVFVKVVHLPEGQEWAECTESQKEEYEKSKEPVSEIEENTEQNV